MQVCLVNSVRLYQDADLRRNFNLASSMLEPFSGWRWCRHFSWELVLDRMAAGVLGNLGNDAVLLVGFTTHLACPFLFISAGFYFCPRTHPDPFLKIDPPLSLALQDHHEQYHHL